MTKGPTLPPTAVRVPHLSAHMLCMTERPTPRTRVDFPEILTARWPFPVPPQR